MDLLQNISVIIEVSLVFKTTMKGVKYITEARFSNGLIERHNAVLEDMLLKVCEDKNVSIEKAL